LLTIQTHYEGLDIAQSGTIFYLRFQLPDVIDATKDEAFKQRVWELEQGTQASATDL